MSYPLFAIGMPGVQEMTLIFLIATGLAGISILPFWFIFKKAGFHPAVSILAIIPYINILMLFYLAFAKWPALNNKPLENKAD